MQLYIECVEHSFAQDVQNYTLVHEGPGLWYHHDHIEYER